MTVSPSVFQRGRSLALRGRAVLLLLPALLCFSLAGLPAEARAPRVVIDFEFSDARDFHEGLAAVKSNDAWGYIDNLGRVALPFVYHIPEAGPFSEGLAFVGDRFIDREGKPVFEDRIFQGAHPFSGGVAAVQSGDLWGYIDTKGSFVIPPAYEDALPFSEGLAPVRKGGYWGYIDEGGRMKIPPQYLEARPFREGRAAVQILGNWGYIDAAGRDIVRASFDQAGDFGYGLAPIRARGVYRGWGYIDPRGKSLIAPRFNAALPFREGLAPVATDARWGYINVRGEMILDRLYDEARPFHEGLAAVRQENRWGFIRAW